MRITETTKREVTEEKFLHTKCDACGNTTEDDRYRSWGDWPDPEQTYDHAQASRIEITIERELKSIPWPEGEVEYRKETWDICPKCFDDIIRKALEERGAKPSVEEYDGWKVKKS